MKSEFPEFFYDELLKSYGKDLSDIIINDYKRQKPVTLRVNTLKASLSEVESELQKESIKVKKVNWYENALIIENVREEQIKNLSLYENGKIYLQGLSSMLPALVLNPKPYENILDMAAAPGGKTTQIAAMTCNEAMITACEKNKIRAERLRYNLEKQGCMRVNVMTEDARKLDDYFSFDKVLLDSPCSGSGTDNIFSSKFSKELIKRLVITQEELLKKAIKVLKMGGELVYSTCSILKQENEYILNKVLNNLEAKIVPIDMEDFREIQMLPVRIKGTICTKPNELYDGFFIAKIKRT